MKNSTRNTRNKPNQRKSLFLNVICEFRYFRWFRVLFFPFSNSANYAG